MDSWFSVHPFPKSSIRWRSPVCSLGKRVCLEQVNAFLLSSAEPINLPDSEVERKDDKLGNQTEPS